MAEIKQLKYMYSKDYREVFEDIATLMFCTELCLEKGVNKRINQRAIESDPVSIDGKFYAYQAKYYDESTKLSAHKKDLIECVKGAASKNVTDLFLYINKDLPDTDPDTGEEAGYIREIEDVASQHSIILHWHTLSMMESSLDMPKYAHIKNQYFGFGKNIKDYYDYVVKLYEKPNTGNTLLGEESLAELYMQPSYYKSEIEIGDVEQLFDEFISNRECGVLWIVGEPGHGKTSMCIKAVANYRNKKRYLQTKGVFWFRLNPQGIPGMVKPKMLALEKVFSWGRITGNRSNMIEPGEIEDSLVFLDGFDELKSSLEEQGIPSSQFYEQVNQLALEYHMHIVVTSRTRALELEKFCTESQLKEGHAEIACDLSDGGVLKNNIKLLAPLTVEKQIAWINELISFRKKKGIDVSDLEKYKHTFLSLQENENMAGLLKIPILLRMIVQNCFEPMSGNRVELYHDLFDKTLRRQGLNTQIERLLLIYREIAFKIFVYDDDCAEINKESFKEITDSDACLYQYYLHTPDVESMQEKANIYRITFIHRSFYQYFLSEFFYEKLKAVTDDQSGENFLKYLWPRHIDPYVLDNLRLKAKNENIDYMQVFKAIDETDAFLSEYKNSSGSIELIGNYDKANNVFWNSISACNSIFQVDSSQKMELTGQVIKLLSKYTCSGILLRSSLLRKAFLRRADLKEADLRQADLTGANLIRADLTGAHLSGADLTGAHLSEADLSGADLRQAHLSGADLTGADLRQAHLSRADLHQAHLSRAHLTRTLLQKANLSGADLSGAHLTGAGLSEADLSGAHLIGADLTGAHLSGANLIGADLSEAHLTGAYLTGAYLSRAHLSGANLSGAHLTGANLIRADLTGANLIRADLTGANLIRADLTGANLSEADLTGANLNGAIFDEATQQKTKS